MSPRRTVVLSALLLPFFSVAHRRVKLWVRPRLARFMHWRLRQRHQSWPARANTITLVFAAHADDEAFGCGGLIAHRIALGETVHVAYLTDGAASHPGHPEYTPAMIADLRAGEARVATGILGVSGSHLTFLNAPDGRLPHLDPTKRAALVARLTALVERLAPAEVFVTSRHDGSSEHSAASALVVDSLAGLRGPRPRLLEYVVWSLWSPLLVRPALRAARAIHRQPLSPEALRLKQNAIHVYSSQTDPLPPWNHAVLPARFTRLFQADEEFYFEF